MDDNIISALKAYGASMTLSMAHYSLFWDKTLEKWLVLSSYGKRHSLEICRADEADFEQAFGVLLERANRTLGLTLLIATQRIDSKGLE